MSNYLREVLGAEKTLNSNQPQGLVADIGPDLPGGEGANEGFWRQQLRDRLGQFAKMLGTVLFDMEIEGLGRVTGHGELIKIVRPQVGVVRIKNHPVLPDGDYEVPGDNLEAIDALIKDKDYERVTGKTLPKSKSSELKDKLTGSEAQARKMSTVYKNLKDEGRFPVPRQTTIDHWGIDSDIAKGAKKDYGLVYDKLKDEDPSWSQKYPTFDDFWERVRQLSVGQTSQSPNELSKIPQEMKDINKAYAEEVLGLRPDGLITFYRNATNRKITPEDSALGYVTTNADFAYDYNSQASNESGNGRYEIDAKPDEVFGMLGYSQLEDEFGVTVGRGVTSQPGRVRRVGDLEQPKLAPWLEKYQDGVGRSTGGTPYRHFALAGQFDLFPVDPLGDSVGEFVEKHGKTVDDIKAKFDELHGQGAYDEYKLSGNALSFAIAKNMFVNLGNGKFGFDITKIDGSKGGNLAPAGYGDGDPATFKNDKLDTTLKMLSVLQELSGQPFMVHRDHPKDDPRLQEASDEVTPEVVPSPVETEKTEDSLDFSNFEKTSDRLGSNPGGVYKDPATGKQYYVKIQDKDRGNNERLASAIYKEAGLGSLEVKDGTLDGNPITYTEWKEDLIPLFGSQSDKLNFTERQEALDTARDGYLIDAWIANWDIVGEGNDNISADKDGNPVRLDAGGALLYRARGSKKGDSFGNEVIELDTFKNPSNSAELMYGNMYLFPRAERESYEKLKAISSERIDELVDQYISNPDDNKELKDKLKARRQFILDKYEGSTLLTGRESLLYGSKTTQNILKEDKKEVTSYTNAGYRFINRHLREPENPDYQRYKDQADKLNDIISANTLTEDTTLIRVTRNFDEDFEPGDIIEDAAIQSTTKAGRSAIHSTVMDKLYSGEALGSDAVEFLGYTTYTIKAPAGSSALDVTEMSQFRNEGEVLLPAGTKFKVISYERKPMQEPYLGSYRNIEVEVVEAAESVESTPDLPGALNFSIESLLQSSLDNEEGAIFRFGESNSKITDKGEKSKVIIEIPDDLESLVDYEDNDSLINEDYYGSPIVSSNSEVNDFVSNWQGSHMSDYLYTYPQKITEEAYKDAVKLGIDDPEQQEDYINGVRRAASNYVNYRNLMVQRQLLEDMAEEFPEDEDIAEALELVKRSDEAAEYFAEKMKEAVPVVAIGTDDLWDVLKNGRFLSQFETGTSSGIYDPSHRAKRELAISGIPINEDPEKRPIYGFLSLPVDDRPSGFIANEAKALQISSQNVDAYGLMRAVLKPSVKDRTTFTMRDSLTGEIESARPVNGATADDINRASFAKDPDELLQTRNYSGAIYDPEYIEAQMHGGLAASDIEKIIIMDRSKYEGSSAMKKLARDTEKLIAELGLDISVEIMHSPPSTISFGDEDEDETEADLEIDPTPEEEEEEEVEVEAEKPSIKSDLTFSTDDMIQKYMTPDDGMYVRMGDTVNYYDPSTGKAEEIKIETSDDLKKINADLGYSQYSKDYVEETLLGSPQAVKDFYKEWYKNNPSREVYMNKKALNSKIEEDSKKLGLSEVDRLAWVEATYDAVGSYAEYENRKALSDLFIDLEEAIPGGSELSKNAVTDREAAKIFAKEIKNAKPVVSVYFSYLDTIFKDGRLKTQFETGKSQGMYDPLFRAKREMTAFGVPLDTDPTSRPIYGYLAFPESVDFGRSVVRPDNYKLTTTSVSQYGDVRLVLKDSTKTKTTFTMQDSLANILRNGKKLSEDIDEESILQAGLLRTPTDSNYPFESGYVEAQIHNGVTLDDIEKIVIPYTNITDSVYTFKHMTKEAAEARLAGLKELMVKYGIAIPIELVDGDI
jgi:hypothetical protein